MGLLQGLIGYVRRSSKKLVQAIFGWAVQALFGNPKASEKTLLSAVVALSAGWPLLLVGIAFPKAAALVLAFVPIPKSIPSEAVRIGWIALAALVPLTVGIVLARHGRAETNQEPFWKRASRGVPVTIAIGAAFSVAFLTSPLLRAIALARRWEDEHLPLITEPEEYLPVAETVRETLCGAGLPVRRARPPWLLTAPSRVLRALGGKILRARLPENLQYFLGQKLEVVVNANGITLQGDPRIAARAHGILSEQATLTPGLQTTEQRAVELEKRIKDVWRVWQSDADHHRGSEILLRSLREISRQLDETFIPYEQWQVLYRELLQLNRTVRGLPQLLEKSEDEEESMDEMKSEAVRFQRKPDGSLRALSSAALLSEAAREAAELARNEIELARAELRADWKKELATARVFGVAVVAALSFVNLLFVAAALWLSRLLPAWAAALAVAGLLLLVAAGSAYASWKRLVIPLEKTRKTLKEGWLWARNRAA